MKHDLRDSQTGLYAGKQDRSMFTPRPTRAPKAAPSKRRFTPIRKPQKSK